jgi:hypothetical protein
MGKRGSTIPIARWWYEAAAREMRRPIWKAKPDDEPGALTMSRLAEMVADSVANVSRCLSGDIPSLHLSVAISDVLRIPRPAYIPQTEQEALAIHGALQLRAADAAIRDIDRELEVLRPGKRARKP